MSFDINILIQCDHWPQKDSLKALCQKCLEASTSFINIALPDICEISFVFTHDDGMRILNKQYRGKDKPTNVLSFPQKDFKKHSLLGDVIFGYETIALEVQTSEKTFQNHLSHLIVHGFLHLLGYDHEEDQQAKEMEQCETLILNALNIDNPY